MSSMRPLGDLNRGGRDLEEMNASFPVYDSLCSLSLFLFEVGIKAVCSLPWFLRMLKSLSLHCPRIATPFHMTEMRKKKDEKKGNRTKLSPLPCYQEK